MTDSQSNDRVDRAIFALCLAQHARLTRKPMLPALEAALAAEEEAREHALARVLPVTGNLLDYVDVADETIRTFSGDRVAFITLANGVNVLAVDTPSGWDYFDIVHVTSTEFVCGELRAFSYTGLALALVEHMRLLALQSADEDLMRYGGVWGEAS